MPYVDKSYYDNDYMGEPVEDVREFDRMNKRASEEIDNLTSYKAKKIDELHPVIQEIVKKAVCAQIEHYAMNGGYSESQQSLGNVRIGPFSYDEGDNSGVDVPKSVINHLKHTGLLYSGVRTW